MPVAVRDSRTVEQAMSGQFAFCFPSTSLAQAARMMAQNRVTELPPIGETCPADLSASEALRRLNTSGGDALLVVDNGGVVGLFGHREALAAFADGSGPVRNYMRRPLPGRNVADSLESGADIMYRED